MTVLYAVTPIFLNAAVGYFLARRGASNKHSIFNDTFFKPFTQLTFRFFIPLMLFASISRADLVSLGEIRNFWFAYFGPTLLIFLLVRLWKSSTISLSVTYSNTALIGIPLILATFGEEGLGKTLTIITFNSLTLFTMVALTGGAVTTTSTSSRFAALIQPLIGTIKNPIIIGLLLGAAVNFLQIPIFAPLYGVISLVGQAELPYALLVLGTSLATVNADAIHEARAQVAAMCALKLLLAPTLVWLVARWIINLDPLTTGVLVTLAACPCGINVLPFAQSEIELRTVSAAIFVSTIISIVTLPAWVYLLI